MFIKLILLVIYGYLNHRLTVFKFIHVCKYYFISHSDITLLLMNTSLTYRVVKTEM